MITCYTFVYSQIAENLEVKIEDKLNKFFKEHLNISYTIDYVPFKNKLIVVIDWDYLDTELVVICFDCPKGEEPEMERIESPENDAWYKCPKCGKRVFVYRRET